MFTRPAGVEQGCLRPREFESTAALTWISSTSSNNETYELQNTLRYLLRSHIPRAEHPYIQQSQHRQ